MNHHFIISKYMEQITKSYKLSRDFPRVVSTYIETLLKEKTNVHFICIALGVFSDSILVNKEHKCGNAAMQLHSNRDVNVCDEVYIILPRRSKSLFSDEDFKYNFPHEFEKNKFVNNSIRALFSQFNFNNSSSAKREFESCYIPSENGKAEFADMLFLIPVSELDDDEDIRYKLSLLHGSKMLVFCGTGYDNDKDSLVNMTMYMPLNS